ncbi:MULTISPECIES: hypothetical protein [Bilophila]|uniref:hypothetical protein n=1 Tax=Bilophila TaxID=35832 RepID=UPI0002238525|nr:MULTISPECIES: hypothetical protein [Bilophila]EGW44703.1 hypothetical protein HMPREF0178_00177 [Bilophila sp. 4_1_30]
MKCPSCGAPGMKRTFNATHDPERFYLCKECGHILSRAKEPWSGKDQRFFVMASLAEQNRLLEEIRDALKERAPVGEASSNPPSQGVASLVHRLRVLMCRARKPASPNTPTAPEEASHELA